jgi:bacterioferritin
MLREELINALNNDLSGELGTIIRYTYQAGQALGPEGAEVRELLLKEVPDELEHARFLTDVIIDLGGEPTTEPKRFNKVPGLRAMLEEDLSFEVGDAENYKHHAQIADQMGEIEIKVRLEEMAADEARHARELRRLMHGLTDYEA